MTPSGAKERTKNNKKTQTINISPLRGDHAPEPIDMPFSILTPVTDIIIPAKFYVDPLKGFWEGAPQKCHFLYFLERPLQQFCTSVQTVIYLLSVCLKSVKLNQVKFIEQASDMLHIW